MSTDAALSATVRPAGDRKRRITILGATGSIGRNTLDLIGRNRDRFSVEVLTASSNAKELAALAIEFDARIAVIADPSRYTVLAEALSGTGIEAAAGADALVEAASRPADWVMAAIVGAAGLRPTFAALQAGCNLALANKECLVSAGDVFMRRVAAANVTLLPVDSEHSAIFQAFESANHESVRRIVLTASGGPFRTWEKERIASATPQDALNHPNWEMGAKITIDCATLMNKGLELIEAWHLFPVDAGQLDVVVHPQSIIHSLVEYEDGSVLAQMGMPDMRTPIAYALSWPKRMQTPVERLDLAALGSLTFEKADEGRFPALRLAREALERAGGAPTVLNAANEIAVEAFLGEKIPFGGIPVLVEMTLEAMDKTSGLAAAADLAGVLELDQAARAMARSLLERVKAS